MLATFLIEISLFIYTVYRYRMDTTGRLAAALLGLLAVFQLAEFISCGSDNYVLWSKIGFVAITLLPALCIHMIIRIAGLHKPTILWGSYLAATAFSLLFLLPEAFDSHVCAGNYVIFRLTPGLGGAYFTYYYGLLLSGLAMCLHYAIDAKPAVRKALVYQVFGYLTFLIPTGIVNAVNPASVEAIPSVMCGFAVMYALTIVFGILPAMKQPARTKK